MDGIDFLLPSNIATSEEVKNKTERRSENAPLKFYKKEQGEKANLKARTCDIRENMFNAD